MSETNWSLEDGILHVAYESDVARAEAHIPVDGWVVEWISEYPVLRIGGGFFCDGFSVQSPGGTALETLRIPLTFRGGAALWQAITGAPKPTQRPQTCPEHKQTPLIREGSRWACADCNKLAGVAEVVSVA